VLSYASAGSEQINDAATVTIAGGAWTVGSRRETIAGLTMTGGTLVKGGGTLVLNGSSAFSGGGTVTTTAAGAGISTGGTATLGNVTFLHDASDDSTAGLILGGGISVENSATAVFSNISSGTGRLNLNNDSRIFEVGSGANLNVGWSVTSSTPASGSLVKDGAGTLTLSGDNSFAGATTVLGGTLELSATSAAAAGATASIAVASGATLLLSQSGQVNDAAGVSLSGGTITRASGVSEVFGNLNLTDASFLNFSGGTGGTIEFSGLDYTPSALLSLQLLNFTQGSSFVIRNTTDLSGLINTGFTFGGEGGFGSSSFSDGTFTITAIPEPSTYLAAAGLLSLMLWPARRRFTRQSEGSRNS
jgi:autotransporter-associated beta strand protein